jgi:hypothetical protein
VKNLHGSIGFEFSREVFSLLRVVIVDREAESGVILLGLGLAALRYKPGSRRSPTTFRCRVDDSIGSRQGIVEESLEGSWGATKVIAEELGGLRLRILSK